MTTILGASASGMVHSQGVMDVVGNNVANVNTAAFKRSRSLSQGAPGPAIPAEGGRLGVAQTTVDQVFQPGTPAVTGDPFHFAIGDDAFFRVLDDSGAPALTRYGALAVDGAGNVTADGHPLDPPLTLPAGWSGAAIDGMGVISAVDEEGVSQVAGQLVLVRLANPQGLEAAGGGLYRETVNSGAAVEGTPGDGNFAALMPGAVEGANVDLAEEFSQMIIAQRAYQAAAKTFSIGDEMLALAANLTRTGG